MKIRLHQFLSKCGEFTSKKEIKEAIWNGEILVNDSIAVSYTHLTLPTKA